MLNKKPSGRALLTATLCLRRKTKSTDGNEKLSELAVAQSHKSAAYKRTRTVILRRIFEYTHRQILRKGGKK